MAMKTLAACAAALALLAAGGCGTWMNLTVAPEADVAAPKFTSENPCPYGGVRWSVELAAEEFDESAHDPSGSYGSCADVIAAVYALAIDVPLSAAADTVTLPYTSCLLIQRCWGGDKSKPPSARLPENHVTPTSASQPTSP